MDRFTKNFSGASVIIGITYAVLLGAVGVAGGSLPIWGVALVGVANATALAVFVTYWGR